MLANNYIDMSVIEERPDYEKLIALIKQTNLKLPQHAYMYDFTHPTHYPLHRCIIDANMHKYLQLKAFNELTPEIDARFHFLLDFYEELTKDETDPFSKKDFWKSHYICVETKKTKFKELFVFVEITYSAENYYLDRMYKDVRQR